MASDLLRHRRLTAVIALVAVSFPLSACSESPNQPLGLSSMDIPSPTSLPSVAGTNDEPPASPPITDDPAASSAPEIEPPLEVSSWAKLPEVSIRTIGNCVITRVGNSGKVNCPGADMRGGNLRGINLTGANLRGANLAGAQFPSSATDADLSGANLTGAKVDYTAFYGTDFSGAIWIDGRVCADGSRGTCK